MKVCATVAEYNPLHLGHVKHIDYMKNVLKADKIIVATHFPFINRHGFYFVKLYQRRSYVIAYENASDIGCTVDNFDKDGFYLRNYNGLLIIGGGTKRTGKGCGFETVSRFASQYYPKAKEKYRYSKKKYCCKENN